MIIKGLIIGLGKIVPGVSGGILAISLGVYEKGLDAISHFFKDVRSNFKFLGLLLIGIMFSVILMSKVIKFSLDNYYLPTMLLFVGLISGGLPLLIGKVKGKCNKYNLLILLLSFSLMLLLFNFTEGSFVIDNHGFLFFVLMGIIDAFTMIVPGISGTAILMLFGAYGDVIGALSNLTNLNVIASNMEVLLPFGIGMIIGTIIFVKLVAYLFKKFNTLMYFFVIGLAISSTVILVFQSFIYSYSISESVIGMLLFVIGYFIGNKLDTEES